VVYVALNIERKVCRYRGKIFYEFSCIFERLVLEGGGTVKTVDGAPPVVVALAVMADKGV
jgi:hypothetical protein